ncbi:Tigger transposable element-derived protein 1-like 148, partial [Homarus americanus]
MNGSKRQLSLAQQTGFNEVTEKEVIELLVSHEKELSNEDLLELEEEQEAKESPCTFPTLTLAKLEIILESMRICSHFIFYLDPDGEHNFNFRNGLENLCSCYKDLHRQKKGQAKQAKVTDFFKPVPQPNEPSASSTSCALFRKKTISQILYQSLHLHS